MLRERDHPGPPYTSAPIPWRFIPSSFRAPLQLPITSLTPASEGTRRPLLFRDFIRALYSFFVKEYCRHPGTSDQSIFFSYFSSVASRMAWRTCFSVHSSPPLSSSLSLLDSLRAGCRVAAFRRRLPGAAFRFVPRASFSSFSGVGPSL